MATAFTRSGPVAYLYVVGSSSDPDCVTCCVPWEVDRHEIFFGPCKKRLREHLKKTVLGDADEVAPVPDIFVVGFNALPSPDGPRSVVWAGRMTRAMTFARAFDLFVGSSRYEEMLAVDDSPLNVLPVRDGAGKLVGYQIRTNGDHRDSDWTTDLVTNDKSTVRDGDRLMLRPCVAPTTGFGRDVVFTLDNLFFANGKGLAVDDDLEAILQAAQPGRRVDTVAVFGRTADDAPDGRRGSYLTISDEVLVRRLVDWIGAGAPRARPDLASKPRAASRRVSASPPTRPGGKRGGRRCC